MNAFENITLKARYKYTKAAYNNGEIKPLDFPADIELIKENDILAVVNLDGYVCIGAKNSNQKTMMPILKSMQLGHVYKSNDKLKVKLSSTDGKTSYDNDPCLDDVVVQKDCLVYLLTDFMIDSNIYKELGEYMQDDRVYLNKFSIKRRKNMAEFIFNIDNEVSLTAYFYNITKGFCFKLDGIDFDNEVYDAHSREECINAFYKYTILYNKEMVGASIELLCNEDADIWILFKAIVDDGGVVENHTYEYDNANEAWAEVVKFVDEH